MAGQTLCVAKMGSIFGDMTKDAKKVVLNWAEKTMQESKDVYVPVLTGNLQSTGNVYVVLENFLEYQVKLAYNTNGQANYAIYVHQIPRPHRHGQYNFLATPYHIRSPELVAQLDALRLKS